VSSAYSFLPATQILVPTTTVINRQASFYQGACQTQGSETRYFLWLTGIRAIGKAESALEVNIMSDTISFRLNDKPVRLNVDANRALLWILRTDLGLTGAKFGCGEGHCGACTVLVDKVAVRSCLLTAKDVRNKEVVTIEGLAKEGQLHPLQKAFVVYDAVQCGFCTPGMILSAYSLLKATPNPSREQILQGMEEILCRCGAHTRIIDAVQAAAAEMKGAQ
jgi:aerobic-type carbon monoxide dehydrogenase small subunit (CoxS/CutS family)